MVNVKLAGIPVCFENRYPDLAILCRGYETEECAVITLSVTQAEVEQERSGQIYEFTDGYQETVPCYRLRCDMTEDSVLAAYEAAQDMPKREHL